MKKGFYPIMSAQFTSSLADNALFLTTIRLLADSGLPSWQQALVVPIFALFYVVLAPFLGAFADSKPKGQVMMLCNWLKLTGCFLMLFGVHPLLAYAIVGFGAATYSPAKYGILTELLPAKLLVKANAWIEISTVLSIILGTILGGYLPKLIGWLFGALGNQVEFLSAEKLAILVIGIIYLIASLLNCYIPRTKVKLVPLKGHLFELTSAFYRNNAFLWNDKLGQITLATTTIFWGASGNMRYLLIPWAAVALAYDESQASVLLGIVACGTTMGAIGASILIRLDKTPRILFSGILLSLCLLSLNFINTVPLAYLTVFITGLIAGFLLVPMNALLQHRGYLLLHAGASIAVQNYNEQLSIVIIGVLLMLAEYLGYSIYTSITVLATVVLLSMIILMIWNYWNFKHYPQRMERLLKIARK